MSRNFVYRTLAGLLFHRPLCADPDEEVPLLTQSLSKAHAHPFLEPR
jgi:hypothetical protein